MTLSVILVSYNNIAVIADCLDSVFEYNDIGDELEVIVVEQSDSDGIADMLRSRYPRVKTVRNANEGFGRGCNLGAEASSGEYLLFLNTDTLLIEPVFSFASEQFAKEQALGAFGVQLVDRDFRKVSSFSEKTQFGLVKRVSNRVSNRFGIFNPKTMYIQGADIFIRRSVFDEIGGFDRALFLYSEDVLLCDAVTEHGYKLRFFPNKRIVHLCGASSADRNSPQRLDMLIRSYRYYCAKKQIDFNREMRKQARLYRLMSVLTLRRKQEYREKAAFFQSRTNT